MPRKRGRREQRRWPSNATKREGRVQLRGETEKRKFAEASNYTVGTVRPVTPSNEATGSDVQKLLSRFETDSDARVEGDLRPVPVPPDSPLYHYTNVSGLKGIIETDALWLSDRVHLNDPTELAYGLQFAREWCAGRLHSADPVTRVFFSQFNRGLNQLLEPIAAYVSSFCLRGDILSQWCRYADDGRGFCLEFSPGFLGTQWNTRSGPGQLFAYLVDYREPEIKARQESCLERAREYIRRPEVVSVLAQESLRRDLVVGMQTRMSYELLWNTLQFKHPAYAEELEARVLLTGDALAVRYSAIHKTRIKGTGFASYVDLPFSPPIRRSGLSRVIVGPAASHETLASAKAFLQSSGLGHVQVIPCAIPYRSTT